MLLRSSMKHTKGARSFNLNPMAQLFGQVNGGSNQGGNLSDDLPRDSIAVKSRTSFVFNNPIPEREALNQPQRPQLETAEKFIRVKSDMEDYRSQRRRRSSCPLVITDKSSDRFNIYDRAVNQQTTTASGTPADVKRQKNTSVHTTNTIRQPPLFYPFNELEQVVVKSHVTLRTPQSLRYQTEYLGLKLQQILNR